MLPNFIFEMFHTLLLPVPSLPLIYVEFSILLLSQIPGHILGDTQFDKVN